MHNTRYIMHSTCPYTQQSCTWVASWRVAGHTSSSPWQLQLTSPPQLPAASQCTWTCVPLMFPSRSCFCKSIIGVQMRSGIVWERFSATYMQFSDSLFCLCLLCMSYTWHIECIGHADKYTLLKQLSLGSTVKHTWAGGKFAVAAAGCQRMAVGLPPFHSRQLAWADSNLQMPPYCFGYTGGRDTLGDSPKHGGRSLQHDTYNMWVPCTPVLSV